MKSPSISTWLLTILPFPTKSFTLPQSPNSSAIDKSLSKPTILLSQQSSSFIIPPSTFSPDAAASYLITFTPTSTPPTPLSRDAIHYCFTRLRVLAMRFDPRLTPIQRPLVCRLVDAVVVVVPVTASVVTHAEVGYLLWKVGAWMVDKSEQGEEGWFEEGVQRWYRDTSIGNVEGLVEVVMSRGPEAGEKGVGIGEGTGVG